MVRHCFVVSALLLFLVPAFSQTGYKIIYKTTFGSLSEFTDSRPPAYGHLVCNDSSSLWYGLPGKKEPAHSEEEYGSKVYHHSSLIALNKKLLYEGVANRSSAKKRYYVSHTLRHIKWSYYDSTKNILGYDCKKAFFVQVRKIEKDSILYFIDDTITAWYSEKIKPPFGPMMYHGLPGLALEVNDPFALGRHILAVEIRKEPVIINIPENISVLTLEEHRKKKK